MAYYPGLMKNVPPDMRCTVRGCKLRTGDRIQCFAQNCKKICHHFCYEDIVLKSNNGENMISLPDGKVACTKACHLNALKVLSGTTDSGRGKWTSDGLGGVNDPNTSMKILLDWMLEEGNYSRYKGKDNSGIKKNQFAAQLCETMISSTTSKNRKPLQVQAKINYLEETFRVAHKFCTEETGQGIEENQDKQTFQDVVRKKCVHYYELLPIMRDRSSTAPKLTNFNHDDLDKYSDDDAEEDEKADDNDDDESSFLDTDRPPKYISTPTKINDTEKEDNGTTTSKRSMMDEDYSISKRSTMEDNSSRKLPAKKNQKKNNKSSRQPSLLDDNTLSIMDIANEQSKEKLAEQKRHNFIIEQSEAKKGKREETRLELDAWKGRNDELSYKVNLVNQYNDLRKSLSKQQILDLFPMMRNVSVTLETANEEINEDSANKDE